MEYDEIYGVTKDAIRNEKKVYVFGSQTEVDTNSTLRFLAYLPYKRWRVVGMGALITQNANNSIAERIEFGLLNSDLTSSSNRTAIGYCTQSSNKSKGWNIGDSVHYEAPNRDMLGNSTNISSGGTSTWSLSNNTNFNRWKEDPTVITTSAGDPDNASVKFLSFVAVEVDHSKEVY